MELSEVISKLTAIRDNTMVIEDRDVITIALTHLEDLIRKQSTIECPACNGVGEWETECCDGSHECSCHGERVPMGRCLVCNGTGKVIEGQYNPSANCDSIRGMSYIGVRSKIF